MRVGRRLESAMVPIAIVVVAVVALCVGPAPAADVSYFEVPRGAHPHDVAPAPDGSIWYTAQSQGALGILNPKTGQAIQISLGKGSAPHGVIVGPDRAAWITDGGQNAIARFEPATKAVKLFPLPKEFPDANLNTATFDRKGILWFTGQNGVYGRQGRSLEGAKGIWALWHHDDAEWGSLVRVPCR
jgi:virginiamycin B lyase